MNRREPYIEGSKKLKRSIAQSEKMSYISKAYNILTRIPLNRATFAKIDMNKRDENSVSLDGIWKFITDPIEKLTFEELSSINNWKDIELPSCWEAQFPDLIDYDGVAWYQKEVYIPKSWGNKNILLRFGAVDYEADVWVNRKYVGKHRGGYLPFCFEIQNAIEIGKNNILTIRVADMPLDKLDIPRGKQDWYCNIGGIWQKVILEAKPKNYFTEIYVTPDIDNNLAKVKLKLDKSPEDKDTGLRITIRITSPNDTCVFSDSLAVLKGCNEYECTIPIENPVLWDTKNPNLYLCEAELSGYEDYITTTFGMRKVEVKNNQICLNGEPIYLIGALDQAFYPHTIYTPPSDEYLKNQFLKAKSLGLNMLRCHIKIPDPRYLEWCDKLGILVWYDVPSWKILTERSKQEGREIIKGALERDYNHPCLFAISIINEGWGIDLSQEDQRQWLKETYDYAKSLDPNRLVIDNSACSGNFHLKTDINDFHVYYSVPDHYKEFANWVKDYSTAPMWTWSPYGDAEITGKEPLIISEFGNWGLPELKKLKESYGEEYPWWFKAGEGPTRPEGVEERFYQMGLDGIYRDFDDLARAFQRHEFTSLKYEIEEIRKHPTISGYVITEFTDLHWESNGLLDFCRNQKVFCNQLAQIQSQDLIIPNWKKINYWSGENVCLDVSFSHFSNTKIEDVTLKWELENFDMYGKLEGITSGIPGAVSSIGSISFNAPDVKEATTARLILTLENTNGEVINRNFFEFYIFPTQYRLSKQNKKVYVYSSNGTLKKELTKKIENLGYVIFPELESIISCVITTEMNEDITNFAKVGGKVLLLALVPQNFTPGLFSNISLVSRNEKNRWGDWVTNFNWIKKGKLSEGLPVVDDLGFLPYAITPHYALEDPCFPQGFENVLGGMFLGWLHEPAAYLAQVKLDKGKILISTYDLIEPFGKDPLATILLCNMINYISSS